MDINYNILVKEQINPPRKYFYLEGEDYMSKSGWKFGSTYSGLDDIAREISLCNNIIPRLDYSILSEDFHNKKRPLKIGIEKTGRKHSIIRALHIEEQRDLIRFIDERGYAKDELQG